LEASFKGDHPIFLMNSKAQNPTLLGLEYKAQNLILLDLKYKAQNKFYSTVYNFLQVEVL